VLVEAVLAGQLEDDAKLLWLREEGAAFAWFPARDPTGELFKVCFEVGGSARRGPAQAMVEILE
jgi:hypothetical protein